MKLLFLRGEVPKDRDPRQIMFNNIDECDDMWTYLAREMSKDGYGEVWYWGGKRTVKYSENFTERWVPSINDKFLSFQPDVIFARGGFKEYDNLLSSLRCKSIYYGAGKRHVPQSDFKKYDLILADSQEQLIEIKKKFPLSKSSLFIKPAAENIFRPAVSSSKQYDVIFVGNEAADDKKGHLYALSSIPKDLSVVCVGISSKKLRSKFPHIYFTGWIPRKKIPEYYAKSKFSLICASLVDSCPRVIPESLACDCPILVLDSVRFWKQKYITNETGKVFKKEDIVKSIRYMSENYTLFSARNYYNNNLSLSISASLINGLV